MFPMINLIPKLLLIIYGDDEEELRELLRMNENLDTGLTGRMLRLYAGHNGVRSLKCSRLLHQRFLKRLEQRLMPNESKQSKQ